MLSSIFFSIGNDSHVSIASDTVILLFSITIASAAILDQDLHSIISHGTKSCVSIVCNVPSLRTCMLGCNMFFKACNAFPALFS
jgi:hypothetical protein